jgi:hypothetical protein
MSSDVADRSPLPLLFVRSLSNLSGCPIINIRSCLQDMKLSLIGPMTCHPLTRFHYSKILTFLCHDYGSFSNISAVDWVGVCIGKFLINLGVRNIFDAKLTWSGSMFMSGWLYVSVHYYKRFNFNGLKSAHSETGTE